ncbi:unnamed protein product [Prunus armeniaca]
MGCLAVIGLPSVTRAPAWRSPAVTGLEARGPATGAGGSSSRLKCENDILKKLDLGPNMTKLLSEHRKEAGGLPPVEDVERWKLHGSDLDDLPTEREKSSTKLPHFATSKSSSRGSRLLSMSSWELLLLHLSGSSASSARTTRRSMACRRSGIFCSGLHSNCPKPMIYPINRLLRSRVWVACIDPGIKLRGLYICPIVTTRLQSHE